ncbi:ORF6N domain-containing protein [Salmonella enterica subsp. enterica serovar Potsdam]|uniref:ORF6N domain-containing protein n=2 Tax=Salmonella enterica TaxID=28901 RepID=A0A722SQZ2_SALER|nr:ORF6N domain-containing protein [Salmonella enterica]EAA3907653.1 ORF6N domain-containing protein [Salmonella enterica subsp. enterica serovar Potsdam]EAA3915837.1 ORF6N domain-containing protein [Salmonella enterica subsp. enterica serovar Kedougou]EBR0200346.1 ORF6N domain-containing protein [Salmonella enterica subsp. enterica serovar Muenster]EBS4912070.1 ORF6N domain-containing protein [Salmonella enterica subsp. enterica serovar Idikan]ECK0008872.1 ORF6N domain-containing protein [Sal
MQQSSSTAVNVAPLNAVVDPLDCPVIVWEGVRVVTTDTLAKGYGTDESNIRKNHSRNNSRFIEGIHIFTVKGGELKSLRVTNSHAQISNKARSVTLWTEKGAARMSKIVDTDEAWSFFERLEDSYFRPATAVGIPLTYEAALEDLLAKVKENRVIAEQRDRAVKEKRWISEKREVTAMATASAAVRAKNKLAERIGEGKNYAAIIPVEKKLGQKFKWQPLRKWCRENSAEPHEVEDPRFGTVKSWPRAAWIAVYGVDLRKIF